MSSSVRSFKFRSLFTSCLMSQLLISAIAPSFTAVLLSAVGLWRNPQVSHRVVFGVPVLVVNLFSTKFRGSMLCNHLSSGFVARVGTLILKVFICSVPLALCKILFTRFRFSWSWHISSSIPAIIVPTLRTRPLPLQLGNKKAQRAR